MYNIIFNVFLPEFNFFQIKNLPATEVMTTVNNLVDVYLNGVIIMIHEIEHKIRVVMLSTAT